MTRGSSFEYPFRYPRNDANPYVRQIGGASRFDGPTNLHVAYNLTRLNPKPYPEPPNPKPLNP